MPDLYIILLVLTGLTAGPAILYFAFKKFEYAIFLIAFSPWIPYMFLENVQEGMLRQDADFTSYLRIGLIILVAVVSLVKFIQYWPRHKGKLPYQFLFLSIFLAIAFLSISYSIDSNITLIRSITFVSMFFFLLGLYAWINEEGHFHKILNTLYAITVMYLVLSFIGMVLTPGRMWWWNENWRFIGIWGHPNTTGIFCLSSYPILLWKYSESGRYKKIFIVALIAFVALMHILTGARSSLAASIVGITVWFIMQRKGFKTVLALVLVALGIIAILQFKPESFHRQNSTEITDLTGRDDFWTNASILIAEKPLAGYGYSVEGKVWSDPRFFKKGYHLWSGNARTSVHNGYISVVLGVGLIGIAVWLTVLFTPFLRILKKEPSVYKSYIFTLIAMMLVINFVESAIDSASSTGAVYFWIAWVMAGKLREMNSEEAAAEEIEDPEEESVELLTEHAALH